MSLRVNAIRVSNILGIESLEIKPGAVTVIEGENGTGKTSVLEAIKAAVSGGHDATLLRAGAERGEIVLVLEDGVEITKEITAKASEVSVKHPQFGPIKKTATYIKGLVDAMSVSPVAFLTADKKDRVELLLKAIPAQLTADQLGFLPVEALNGVNLDKHALEVISTVGTTVYDLRTGVNRAAKEKRATAAQMKETLPAEAPEGNWDDALKTATDEFRKLQRDTQTRIGGIKSDAQSSIDALKELCQAKKDAIAEEEKDAVERLREEFEAACNRVRLDSQVGIERCESERDQSVGRIEGDREEALKATEAEYQPKHRELTESVARSKAMIEAHTKAQSARDFIARLNEESGKLEAESAKLTSALSKLEVLKASLLDHLPIKGMEIKDGEIYMGDVPYDRINEARRMNLAIEVAKLRAGKLGLVCVDGLEQFSSKTFEAFAKAAEKSGLQFIVSRVSDAPSLSVNSELEVKKEVVA